MVRRVDDDSMKKQTNTEVQERHGRKQRRKSHTNNNRESFLELCLRV